MLLGVTTSSPSSTAHRAFSVEEPESPDESGGNLHPAAEPEKPPESPGLVD